jgi:hypothetical protein
MKRSVIISGTVFLHLNCRIFFHVPRSNTGDITSMTAEYAVQKSANEARVTKTERRKSAYGLCRGRFYPVFSLHFDPVCSLHFDLIWCSFDFQKNSNTLLYRCYIFRCHTQGALHQDLKLYYYYYYYYYYYWFQYIAICPETFSNRVWQTLTLACRRYIQWCISYLGTITVDCLWLAGGSQVLG